MRAPAWTDRVLWKRRKNFPDTGIFLSIRRTYPPSRKVVLVPAQRCIHGSCSSVLPLRQFCRSVQRRHEFLILGSFIAEVGDEDWNPGTLVLYNRAELKQSDHRPVIAVIDIDVFRINEALRDSVFDDVIQYLGPPDATIVVQVRPT